MDTLKEVFFSLKGDHRRFDKDGESFRDEIQKLRQELEAILSSSEQQNRWICSSIIDTTTNMRNQERIPNKTYPEKSTKSLKLIRNPICRDMGEALSVVGRTFEQKLQHLYQNVAQAFKVLQESQSKLTESCSLQVTT